MFEKNTLTSCSASSALLAGESEWTVPDLLHPVSGVQGGLALVEKLLSVGDGV